MNTLPAPRPIEHFFWLQEQHTGLVPEMWGPQVGEYEVELAGEYLNSDRYVLFLWGRYEGETHWRTERRITMADVRAAQ